MYPVTEKLLKEARRLQQTIETDLNVLYGVLLPNSPPDTVKNAWLGNLDDLLAEFKIKGDDYPIYLAERLVSSLKTTLVEIRTIAHFRGVTLPYSNDAEGRTNAKMAPKEAARPRA
jgi:hypothetical protein